MAATKAVENKRIRQEALRDQLSNQKHIEYIVKNIEVIEGLEPKVEGGDVDYKDLQLCQFTVQKLKAANEQRMKLVDKYLPSLKQTDLEVSGPGGETLNIDFVVEFIVPKDPSTS